VKIAKVLSFETDLTLKEKITQTLSSLGGKFTFGISVLGKSICDDTLKLSVEVKHSLEALGIKTRFVLPKSGDFQLSSVLVAKQKVNEIVLFKNRSGQITLGHTFWIQDFEGWGKRDYSRPQASGHIGMLPPKVARMMINIGLQAADHSQKTILDPFCGVGTILMEGLVLGCQVLGSDQDQSQVERTRENLKWLTTDYGLSTTDYDLFCTDARNIGLRLDSKRVDAIITEPDLGPNNLARVWSSRTVAGLQNLYVDCLKNWQNILKPQGRVVIALPKLGQDDRICRLVIDKAEAMGYSLQAGPVEYSRPGANVKRLICSFQYGPR
jgi:tRNA G10  N-methylase Trm11